jgi:Kef-type K+ transport system membrane component KefB
MHQTESVLFSVLLQLIVIVLAARCANELSRRIGQPGAVGEIVVGLLLGPSLLGCVLPDVSQFLFKASAAAPIAVISQIGLILLMFQVGSDFEFSHLKNARNRRMAITVATVSIATPLLCGILLGYVAAASLAPNIDSFTFSLFVGVALAITAVPILGRILREYGLTRTEVGVISISAAALNDVVGWVLLACIAAYASAHFSAQGAALQIGSIITFAIALWFVSPPLVKWLLQKFPLTDGRIPSNLMAATIALIFAAGICTYLMGIFSIFGGFAAGLLFHREHEFVEAWRRQIGHFVLVFFLPIFFTYTGLRTNVLGLTTYSEWMWLSSILAVAVLAKIFPVYAAARLSGFSQAESSVMGALMNTRALMELIVLNIGFDLGFIPQPVFTMLVIMAVTTTVMTAPLLRILLPRTGHVIPLGVEA